MSILEFLVNINGMACLVAGDGQVLGLLSSDQFNPDSITNPYGIYGSSYGVYSICNQSGIYGSPYGVYSPYNPHCINPPVIGYQGQAVVMVTRNNYAVTNGLPIIDPDFLLDVYAQLASFNTPHDRINRAAAETMRMLNEQSAIIASMFR